MSDSSPWAPPEHWSIDGWTIRRRDGLELTLPEDTDPAPMDVTAPITWQVQVRVRNIRWTIALPGCVSIRLGIEHTDARFPIAAWWLAEPFSTAGGDPLRCAGRGRA